MSGKSFVYNIGGNYQTISKKRIVEGFGLNIANDNSTTDTTTVKNATNLEESLDQNTIIKGTSNMLSEVINDVISKNISEINRMINASNKVVIKGAKTGGTFSLTNVTQTGTINSEQNEETSQTISNKIVQEISSTIKSKIDTTFNNATEEQKNNSEDMKEGTDLGSTLASLGQTLGNTAAEILNVSVGNSTSSDTTKTVNTEFNNKMKVEKNFEMQKDNNVNNTLKTSLSAENIKKSVEATNAGQDFQLSDIDAEAGINIADIKQVTAINKVMNNVLNQSVMTEISTKIVQEFDDLVNRMIISSKKFSDNNIKTSTSGDLYAAGVAARSVLAGVGEAAVGVGEGTSTAAQGIGEGVSTGAQGVGKGFAAVLQSATLPLLIGGIILIIAVAVYIYGKQQGWFK